MHIRSIRTRLHVVFLPLTILLLSTAMFAQAKTAAQVNAAAHRANKVHALTLPLSFEANRGQTDGRVKFLSRGPGYSLFLTQDEAVLSLRKVRSKDSERLQLEREGVVRLKLVGANSRASIAGEEQTTGKTRYYIGKDPSKWQADVPSFERVRYSSIYPGIDVVYYGNQRTLEYDFIVKPGANPKKIRLQAQGSEKLSVENGDLVMAVGDSSLRMLKPVVYQEIEGKRREVNGRFVIAKNKEVTFAIGKYDRRYALVIDPVLSYSSFLGGSGDDVAYSIAVNGSTIYLAGITSSADFPLATGSLMGNFDVFVTAIDGTGGITYSTYLGGTGEDVARSISVAADGFVYVGGYTSSDDFPTTGGVLSRSPFGGAYDGFVAQLSPSGLVGAAGYYGGLGNDQILGIRYDATAGLVATGYTQSADFPAMQTAVPLLPPQLYASADSGLNWTNPNLDSNSPLKMMDVRALQIVDSTYYAGGSGGVYSSADGTYWTKMFSSPNAIVTCLVPDYGLSNALFACTDRGLYHWDGTMWKVETGLPATEITTIATSVYSPLTVYVGTSKNGVYRSFDGGETWSQINSGLPVTNIRSLLAVGATLYTGTISSNGNPVFYRFNGSTWSATANYGLPPEFSVSANSLYLGPNGNDIYVGIEGNGAFVTADGGDTWIQLGTELLSSSVSSYVNAFAIESSNSNNIYVATDDGVWQSTDAGSSFQRADVGFTATSVKALIITASGGPGQTSLLAGVNAQQGFAAFFKNFLPSKATLFGGDGVTTNGGTEGRAVTSDAQGNVYVTGSTSSVNLPPKPSNSYMGNKDAFAIKYDSSGNATWSRFIGGLGVDVGNAVATDGTNVYIGGTTFSNDFPTTSGAYATGCNNNCASSDGFFTKISAGDGTVLASSTFGGVNADEIRAIAPDTKGNIYVAGMSNGNTLPLANPVAPYPGTNDNAFVSEFSPDAKSLLFSSLLGGSGQSMARAMVIDSADTVYVAGHTYASDFPVAGEVQRTIGGGSDAFVTKITSNGNTVDVAVSVTPTSVNSSSGTPVTFGIKVTNNSGNVTATNVAVSTNLSLDTFTSVGGTCSTTTRVCIFDTIAPGATVDAAAQHTYPVPGVFSDTFIVRADESDSDLTNNQQIISATVTQAATDVGISVAGPSNVSPGQQFNYTVQVTNFGPATANDFTFTVTFDPALDAALPNLPNCSKDGSVMTCIVSTLQSTASLTFNFAASLPSSTAASTLVTTAAVTFGSDSNPDNNSSSASSTVVPGADLHVAAYGPEIPTLVGAPATLDVSVIASAYTDPATNVVLTFLTAGALKYNSSSGLGTCSGTGTITCLVAAQMLPGEMVRGTIAFTPLRPGQFTVKVVASSDSNDPIPDDNVGYATVTAVPVLNAYESYLISDTASGQVKAYNFGSSGGTISTPNAGDAPGSLALDVGGRYAFVSASGFAAYTSVVDFTTGTEVARIRGVISRPAVITPDGTRFIGRSASRFEDAIQIVDTSTFQVIRKVSLDGLFGDQSGVLDLNILSGVVANNKLYLQLSTPTGSNTGVVNLSTYEVSDVTGANTGAGASTSQKGIASNGDGSRVYALRRGSESSAILVINTSTDAVIDTISVPIANSQGIAVTPDPNDSNGQFAYIVGSGLIAAIDLNTRTQAGSNLSLGVAANLIVLSSDGNLAQVFRSGYSSTNNAALVDVSSLRNGYMSAASPYSVGSSVGGVAAGFVTTQPLPNSPVVSDVAPYYITDPSVTTKVSVFGSNFSNGAKVKIGNLDPLPSTFVSSGRLDVTLPAGIGEQDAEVTVTLPNGQEIQTRKNVSAVQSEALQVKTPFQLHDPLIVLQHGDSTVSYISQAKNGNEVALMTPNPLSMAISPDGTKVFVSGTTLLAGGPTGADGLIEVLDIATGKASGHIWATDDLPGYQDGFAIGKDPLDGKNVLYFVSKDPSSQNERLSVIELDSGMYGLKRFYTTNFGDYSAANTVVASPDGQYVYAVTSAADPTTGASHGYRLVSFNNANGEFTQLANIDSVYGVEPFPNHMRLSPDGKWLVLPASDGGMRIFDVGTNPATPAFSANVFDAGRQFKNFQIVGSRLFAFDSINNIVAVYDTTTWARLGWITVPGVKGVYEAPMTVDSTGAYIYLALKDEDSLVVLDANKVAASDPTAVLAQGVAGKGMESILIPTITSSTVDLSAMLNAYTVTTSPGLNVDLYGQVSNDTLIDAHDVVVTVNLPPEMTAQSATYYGPTGTYGSCTLNGAQVLCNIGTVPGTQAAVIFVTTNSVVSTGSLLFNINASSTEPDADSSNNQQQYLINSVPPVDLKTTAKFPPLPIQAGQPISYTFDVANIGTGTATNVYVSVTSVLTNLSVTATEVTCSPYEGNAFCQIPTLAGGATVQFTVNGYAPTDSPILNLSNSASVQPPNAPDIDLSNNSADAKLPVSSGSFKSPAFVLTNADYGQIQMMDPATSTQSQISVEAGVFPADTVFMPNGRTAFVPNLDAYYVSVIDLGVRKEIYRIKGVSAGAAALTSDAKQLIVSDRYTSEIVVIDTRTFQITKRISVGFSAASMIVVGSKAYIIRPTAAPVTVLDLNTGAVTPIAGTNVFGRYGTRRIMQAADAMIIALGGGTQAAPAILLRIDPGTDTLLQSLPIPTNTANLTITVSPMVSGPSYAYVTYDAQLSVVDVGGTSQTLMSFVPGLTATLDLVPTASALSTDGANLGFIARGSGVYPNYEMLMVGSLGSQPEMLPMGIPGNLLSITSADVDVLPDETAPIITSVDPQSFLNNAPQVITLTGSNFQSDTLVKIGKATPLPATVVSSTQISVTVPQFTPSGDLDILAINPNAGQDITSVNLVGSYLDGKISVANGPGYDGQWDTYVANYGNQSVTVTKGATTEQNQIDVPNPWGVAVTADNVAFGTSGTTPRADSSLEGVGAIQLPGNVAYGDALAAAPDTVTGLQVVLIPTVYPVDETTNDWTLNVIDADPFSPTAGTTLRRINVNSGGTDNSRNGFAASADGKKAYLFYGDKNSLGMLAIFDLATGQVTKISALSLGVDDFIQSMQVSPDGKYLAIANYSSRNVKVFDTSNLSAAGLKGTITPFDPGGTYPDCCNLRIVNERIWVFDPGTRVVQGFNFKPDTADFSPLGYNLIPGSLDPTFQGGLAASPDGKTLFVAEYQDDAISVYDADAVANSSPNPLLARIATGVAPVSIGVSQIPTFSHTADLAVTVTHSPDPVAKGADLTYTVTVTNLGPYSSGQSLLSDDLPAGMTLTTSTVPPNASCTGTTSIRCQIGEIAPNQNMVFTFVVSTANVSAGPVTNSASISMYQSSIIDSVVLNNTGSTTVVVGLPDTTVSVTSDVTTPPVNGLVTYTVSAKNNGTVPATNAMLKLSLSAGTWVSSPDCTIDADAQCTADEIPAGGTATIKATAKMPGTPGTVTLTANVIQNEVDANPADNITSYSVTVVSGTAADLVLVPASAPIVINGKPTYTVTVTNNGPDTATNVTVSDELTRFGYDSSFATVGSCAYDGVKVSCSVGDLANGASAVINVSVVPPESGWALNEFRATSSVTDPNPLNNVVDKAIEAGIPGNTAAGLNVSVDVLDSATGEAVNFLFGAVNKPGMTSVSSSAASQPPPGYRFGSPARVYELTTTAAYAGAIRVTLSTAGIAFHHPDKVRLFHFENGVWVDCTSAIDRTRGLVAAVTTSLSPFIVAEPVNAVPVANAGADHSTSGTSERGATVSLSAAASTDADGDALTYRWTGPFTEGNGSVTGMSPSVTLPMGTSKLTLVANDGEIDSPPATVNVTVTDFLVAADTNSITLRRGGTATFTVAVTPKYGAFDASVALACGNLPGGVTCAFSSNSVTPGINGDSVTVTLAASPNAGLLHQRGTFAFWMAGVPVVGLLLTGTLRRKKLLVMTALLAVLAIIAVQVGCGAGSSVSVDFNSNPETGATTSITVTGNSAGLQHSATTTVTLQ